MPKLRALAHFVLAGFEKWVRTSLVKSTLLAGVVKLMALKSIELLEGLCAPPVAIAALNFAPPRKGVDTVESLSQSLSLWTFETPKTQKDIHVPKLGSRVHVYGDIQ